MNFNSIKKSVWLQIAKLQFTPDDPVKDNTNRILATGLVINTIETLIKSDSSYSSKISELAKNYAGTYRSEVLTLEKKFATYAEMRYYIESDAKINSPLSLTQHNVQRIIELYMGKLANKEFSLQTYSHLMYKVTNLKYADDIRLRDIHKKIFVPIVKQYITFNGIRTSDVSINNILYSIPGKVIDLSINGIDPAVIKADLDNDTIGVSKYIYESKLTSDGKIRITTRTL